jgi:hypothetical protein
MNERIRELADQALKECDVLNALNRFAELIVRECANVAAEHEALDIYEEIREHFGVEE